ncbi:MAG: 5-(carboxyamino)imidazole ribonucleotide mutase [Phycisphaerae bacterium]|nr:5-(carboxyamino)imidazole ribonucleotide mutase [Phycisphaerae bacterium]
MSDKPIVGVVMGSDSDLEVMKGCLGRLGDFGIAYEVRIISAHRTPAEAHEFAATARDRGLKVIIAAAGMSAALGGVLAANTTLPVIGVPMAAGPLVGVDAALSTMQMPPGIPVGCMAIGSAGAKNAAIYAAEILAVADEAMATKLATFKQEMAAAVVEKDRKLQSQG